MLFIEKRLISLISFLQSDRLLDSRFLLVFFFFSDEGMWEDIVTNTQLQAGLLIQENAL